LHHNKCFVEFSTIKKGEIMEKKIFFTHHVYEHGSGAFYFFGFIGATVYYISHATGFWMGVLGFLKAIVWPAFLVHGLLKFLGM